MLDVDHAPASATPAPGLRRSLSIWQVLALSIGLMAPSMAANINPQVSARSVGRAVPLAFALAMVGILFVSYGFVRLSQRMHTSGSVYGLVGATLGPRLGAVAGWALMGCYAILMVTTASTAGLFATDLLGSTGVWASPPTWAPYLVGVAAIIAAWALASLPARGGTAAILAFEAVTVAAIAVVSVVVVARLLGHSAPTGQRFSWQEFSLPAGTGLTGAALGAVFGFLSFAGFEAAATLGEEAHHPRRDIPRAIFLTVAVGGVFYIVVSAVEVLGFGTSNAGTEAFAASGSLLGDLGHSYVTAWIGDLITFGTTISAVGCCTACLVGSSRLLYSLARDGRGTTSPLASVSPRWGTPTAATTLVAVTATAILVGMAAGGIPAFNSVAYSGQIGTLIILAVYISATAGAVRLLFGSTADRPPRWEVAIPVVAVAIVVYVIYRNVVPYPTGAGRWLPVAAFGWITLGVVAVMAAPATAARIGGRLVADAGLWDRRRPAEVDASIKG